MLGSRRLASSSLLVLPLLLAAAFAQEVTGTISATLGEEARTWRTLAVQTEKGTRATATWFVESEFPDSIVVQGHPSRTVEVEGTLSIEVRSTAGFDSACPCTFSDGEVTYWTSSSSTEDVYRASDAEVTLHTVDALEDDAYRVEGSFAATALFHPHLTDDPDAGDTLPIEGTFEVERLPRLEVE